MSLVYSFSDGQLQTPTLQLAPAYEVSSSSTFCRGSSLIYGWWKMGMTTWGVKGNFRGPVLSSGLIAQANITAGQFSNGVFPGGLTFFQGFGPPTYCTAQFAPGGASGYFMAEAGGTPWQELIKRSHNYLIVTCTLLRAVPSGTYNMVFNKNDSYVYAGGETFVANLVGINGNIVTVSAPNNTTGYSSFPPGIINQSDNGDGTWTVSVNTNIVLGSGVFFRPQMVFPLPAAASSPNNFIFKSPLTAASDPTQNPNDQVRDRVFSGGGVPPPSIYDPIFSENDLLTFPSQWSYDPSLDPGFS